MRERITLLTLDSWLIDRCERFSHRTQTWFGLSSATWERWSFLISGFFFAMKELPEVWRDPFAWIVLFFIALRFVHSFRDRGPAGIDETANPEKTQYRLSRPVLLIVASIWVVPDFLGRGTLSLQFWVLGWYFAACDDLPPGESKVKQLLKSFRGSLARQPIQEGA